MLAEFLITNVILASGLIIALIVCCLFGANPECPVWFYLGAFTLNNSHIILTAFKVRSKESAALLLTAQLRQPETDPASAD